MSAELVQFRRSSAAWLAYAGECVAAGDDTAAAPQATSTAEGASAGAGAGAGTVTEASNSEGLIDPHVESPAIANVDGDEATTGTMNTAEIAGAGRLKGQGVPASIDMARDMPMGGMQRKDSLSFTEWSTCVRRRRSSMELPLPGT